MNQTSRDRGAGFSLVEVVIAIGIAAFCLLTLFALLPMGLTTSQNASEQTVVAGIATAISADLHGTPIAGGTTSRLGLVIPMAGHVSVQNPSVQTLFFAQDGSVTGSVGANAVTAPAPSLYRVTVTIRPDAPLSVLSGNTKLYKVWVLITWPGLGDPSAATFPSHFSGSFETLTALDCN